MKELGCHFLLFIFFLKFNPRKDHAQGIFDVIRQLNINYLKVNKNKTKMPKENL